MTDTRDSLYADPLSAQGIFRFDHDVARVFPDMIKRSVPGYATIVAMTGLLGGKYASAGSNLYDLGCSLGASTLALRQNIQQHDCRIISVDNSSAMLERCRAIVDADPHPTPVSLVRDDVLNVDIANASVVVLNFTLQFIPREQRDGLLARIHDGLLPGGMLLLSEKVRFEDRHLDELNIELHHRFKLANGYSELEVARKRAALETVLLPETLAEHRARMAGAGFNSCDVWFQCFNFASLIALK